MTLSLSFSILIHVFNLFHTYLPSQASPWPVEWVANKEMLDYWIHGWACPLEFVSFARRILCLISLIYEWYMEQMWTQSLTNPNYTSWQGDRRLKKWIFIVVCQVVLGDFSVIILMHRSWYQTFQQIVTWKNDTFVVISSVQIDTYF